MGEDQPSNCSETPNVRDAMDTDTTAIFDNLDELLARYEKWEEPLRRYQAENFVRLNKEGYTWERFESGLRELAANLRAESDPHPELFQVLERLCSCYVACDFDTRAEIRAFVAQRKRLGELVWNYANYQATRLKDSGDSSILRVALVAVSIENCGYDYRDTLTTLADLFVSAEEVGIDPKPVFQAVADLSTDAPTPGGCDSLAGILRDFESYAVLGARRASGPATESAAPWRMGH
jgi:hypothetical protein